MADGEAAFGAEPGDRGRERGAVDAEEVRERLTVERHLELAPPQPAGVLAQVGEQPPADRALRHHDRAELEAVAAVGEHVDEVAQQPRVGGAVPRAGAERGGLAHHQQLAVGDRLHGHGQRVVRAQGEAAAEGLALVVLLEDGAASARGLADDAHRAAQDEAHAVGGLAGTQEERMAGEAHAARRQAFQQPFEIVARDAAEEPAARPHPF